jgi:hypothetical protein
VLSTTEFVTLFWDIGQVEEHSFSLFGTGNLIDGGIERTLFLPIMGTEQVQQRLFFLIAIQIPNSHLAVNGFKLLPNLVMLVPHSGRRPAIGHAGFLFPERKEQILFPHDMALQADHKFFERLLSLGKVRPLQLLKGLEQLVQPVMILLKKPPDSFPFTHDVSFIDADGNPIGRRTNAYDPDSRKNILAHDLDDATFFSSMPFMLIAMPMIMVSPRFLSRPDRRWFERGKPSGIGLLFRQFDKYHDHGLRRDLELTATSQQVGL